MNRFILCWVVNLLEGKAEGCSEWGYILLVAGHQCCCPGHSPRASPFSLSDLDAGIEYLLSKFADVTNLVGAADYL